jgi:hypothetical protein
MPVHNAQLTHGEGISYRHRQGNRLWSGLEPLQSLGGVHIALNTVVESVQKIVPQVDQLCLIID